MAAAKKAKKAAPKKAAKKKVFQIHDSGAAPQGSAPVLSARRRLHVAVVGFAVGFIEQCLTSSNDAVQMMTVLDCNHPTDRTRVVSGKSVSVRVDLGGRRIIKKKNRKMIRNLIKINK